MKFIKIKKSLLFPIAGASLLIGTNSVQASEKAHTVEEGETLSEISAKYNEPIDSIVEVNDDIDNPNLIYPSDIVHIPAGSTTSDADGEGTSDDSTVTENETTAHAPAIESTGVNVDLLSRLIESEAKGESYQGKVAVGQVVMNRIASGQFPNDLHSVVYQQGQFVPASTGAINRPSTNDSVQAANEAISIGGNPNGALYFYNAQTASSRWLDTRETVSIIGNHTFKR